MGGIDLCVTEFIRVTDLIIPKHVLLKFAPELLNASKTPNQTPVLVQFLGSNKEMLAANALNAVDMGASGIDLNFGCPAKTVNRHDGGATLLKDPKRIFEIVSSVRRAVPSALTVSAKIRLGFHDKSQFLEIAHAVESAGASFLTVHARTRDEAYRPPAHWEYIGQIREALKIPVIANGDIWDLQDFKKCREVSGCESFMLGRGLIANPSLARQIQGQGSALKWSEMLLFFRDFIDASEKKISPAYALSRSKQWCKQLARTYPEAAKLFEIIKVYDHLEKLKLNLVESAEETPNFAANMV
jgi:tRNA-dihydrouridine synthase C